MNMQKRENKTKEKRISLLSLFTNLCILGLILWIASGTYICPFYYLFHIPCPGCGMTRACKALLRLDLSTALYYNWLFPIPIFWALYQPLRRFVRFEKKCENVLLFASALLFFIRWFIILFE